VSPCSLGCFLFGGGGVVGLLVWFFFLFFFLFLVQRADVYFMRAELYNGQSCPRAEVSILGVELPKVRVVHGPSYRIRIGPTPINGVTYISILCGNILTIS
jgi:hypothetical protein